MNRNESERTPRAERHAAPANERAKTDDRDPRFSPPAVSLPKGGGAIKGIGEKFTTNAVNGSGAFTIPLPLSPARAGFTPALALDYDSGSGNGPYGYGWRIGYPAITRRTDRGLPQYRDGEDSDTFLLSGAEDLVSVLRQDGTRDEQLRNGYRVARYRPRIEGAFARIERWTSTSNAADVFWRTISRDNMTSVFGKTAPSRIADPADPARIFTWLVSETFDDKGNASVYEYVAEDSSNIDRALASEADRSDASRSANRYLKRVKYGNRTSRLIQPDLSTMEWLFELVMDYGDHDGATPSIAPNRTWPARPDPFSASRAGFEVRTDRRCRRILMFHRIAELGAAPRLVRALELDYDDFTYPPGFTAQAELAHPGSTRHGSFLRRVIASGYADSGTRTSMPPLELTYSRPHVVDELRTVAAGSDHGLPVGLDGIYHWVDLHGEGLSGVLSEQGSAWWYKPNLGDGELGLPQLVAQRPSLGLGAGGQLLDLAADGSLDLVHFAHSRAGFFEHDERAGWSAFQPFTSQPELDWRDPNLKFVDLTGDGHADILITHDDVLHWHPSLAEDGFGPRRSLPMALDEARGPKLVLHDVDETIFLADLTGDGLSDLVRIRNAQICYWPNLGYGRFGTRVTMDQAPVLDTSERFDARRIRLADIDGSGTTDLIYLGADGVRLYFNRSGNSWTPALALRSIPRIDRTTNVQVTDLRGNGTAFLVWSSPLPGNARVPLRFVDLMGGEKPHLLVRIENNLGARTIIEYAASTKFYLQDRRAGRPWVTRLPFPVHVVARVISCDDISHNRFVSRFAYHHGHFDGVEREFRGFGMVEQIDAEELSALGADLTDLPATNVDAASNVPPVLTRTWFHTGIYLGRDRVSRLYAGLVDGSGAGEYYREPGLSDAEAERRLLDDTVLPAGLTTAEEREAARALKGTMLRQEIYALDGSARQPHPYAVTEQNAAIRMLQPMGSNPHAVFFTHAHESIGYHYDRVPSDPRVTHALTLEVDDFGNTLKSASVTYGRRQPEPTLAARDQASQAALHIVCADNRFTNDVQAADDHRTPLAAETKTYELTGVALAPGTSRFTLDQVRTAAMTAVEIPYEQAPAPGVAQKRLIERVQTLYRRNDLTAALPVGQVESLALPFESYKLAITPGLVTGVYGTKITDAMLAGDGGYVHRDGDTQWWIPSGRAFLSAGAGDAAATELASARQHFFQARRFRDPFGQITMVTFDAYDLLVTETRDPLGNRTTAGERDAAGTVVSSGLDYRVLQARAITDPNGNRAAVSYDALGMVVGTAVMGKRDETPRRGDLLDSFVADLADDVIAAQLGQPFADPMAILQRATTRVVYERFAYHRTKHESQPQPSVIYVVSRETHDADLTPSTPTRTQHAFSYSDGFGREIQRKSQAEPARVPPRGVGVIVEAPGGGDIPDPGASFRWVGSGWTVFNNKGMPVRTFEPFFTDTQSFESDVRIGVSPIVCYDPIGRVVATLYPDHSWDKQIVTAWRQDSWDVNDTALIADPRLDPDVGDQFRRLDEADYLPTWYAQRQGGALGPDEQTAAARTAAHAATPSRSHSDSLGRTCLTLAHNRFDRVDAAAGDPPIEELYTTRTVLDIEGNPREIVDAADRIVERYDHDMLGNRIHHASMEAGERWMLGDVSGMPIHGYNSRGHHLRTEYDALHRPVRAFVQGAVAGNPTAEILFSKTDYGEGQANDAQLNLRTRPCRRFDATGVITNDAYDFKGNPLTTHRQLVQNYKEVANWSATPALDPTSFTSATTYDALNRPTAVTAPDASVYVPTYNDANLLERVDVRVRGAATPTAFVVNIDYDAKGQRERIEYGNQVRTEYTYDPLTFRLVKLQTTRLTNQSRLQDLSYTYDAIGNITQIHDGAQQTTYFSNQVVTPDNSYVYDAIYRLIHSDGREHIGQATQPQTSWNDQFRVNLPQPGDGQAMRRYREHYRYDGIGNFLELIHQATGGNWTRGYTYNEASAIEPTRKNNRLTCTLVGAGPPEAYGYDAHGNTTAMPHLTVVQWDFQDRLSATARQVVNQGTPETTYYVYSANGERARKVTERQNGTRKSERIYLGGVEVYREYDAAGTTVTLERGTLHVMDDDRRIALVETRVQGTEPSVPQQLIRYQIDNHLSSATLELDGHGQIISYEEYYPFGSTSYQAGRSVAEVKLKRYRFTRMERDDETGFTYHGARYCAPWLGRWISPDPAGIGKDGTNLYAYVANNPISKFDPTGLDGDDDKTKGEFQWAKSKQENDARAKRLGYAWNLIDAKGISRSLYNELDDHGDIDVLEHYGFENPGFTDRVWPDARRELRAERLQRAIQNYQNEYNPRPTSMGPLTQETIDALNAKAAQLEFYRLWVEGWNYVSSSVLAAVSAGIASKFTNDQKKITAAAGLGAAVEGVATSGAQYKAAAIQAKRSAAAQDQKTPTTAKRLTGADTPKLLALGRIGFLMGLRF